MSATNPHDHLAGPMPEAIAITRYGIGKTSVLGSPATMAPNELAAMLTTFVESEDKDHVGFWSPVTLHPGKTRSNGAVQSISCCVADLDGISREQLDSILGTLGAQGIGAVWHTTHSFTGGTLKVRMIVPLSRAVAPNEWPILWPRINGEIFGGLNDPATKDPSRAYYVPSHRPGVQPLSGETNGDGALDPDALLAVRLENERRNGHAAPLPQRLGAGERNSLLTSLAGSMRRRGASEEAILQALITENQIKCDPPLTEDELGTIARSVARYQDDLSPLLTLQHTDVGNAKRFVYLFGHRLRYCHLWRKWLVWDGRRWQKDDAGQVMAWAKETLQVTIETAAQYPRDHPDVSNATAMRDALISEVRRAESGARIERMIALARSEPGIAARPSDFDADSWLLNVLNGTLDLRTGLLLLHDPSRLITKLAPVTYDPRADAPRWRQFLAEVFRDDQQLIEYVQRIIGYCLTGDTREQVFFLLYGDGQNGKSKFLAVLRGVLSDYTRSTAFKTFEAGRRSDTDNDLAALQGARLVTSIEAEQDRVLAESRIKTITGSDPVSCRFLYGEYFEYTPEFKLLMAVNHLPVVRGTDHGIWRRVRLIPFEARFEGDADDKEIEHKLLAEKSGILNMLLEGCREWLDRGLDPPPAVLRATADYRSQMDTVAEFIDEKCTTGNEHEIKASLLYGDYQYWSKERGEHSMSQRSLGMALSKRGFTRRKAFDGWHWGGLKLREIQAVEQMIS